MTFARIFLWIVGWEEPKPKRDRRRGKGVKSFCHFLPLSLSLDLSPFSWKRKLFKSHLNDNERGRRRRRRKRRLCYSLKAERVHSRWRWRTCKIERARTLWTCACVCVRACVRVRVCPTTLFQTVPDCLPFSLIQFILGFPFTFGYVAFLGLPPLAQ